MEGELERRGIDSWDIFGVGLRVVGEILENPANGI